MGTTTRHGRLRRTLTALLVVAAAIAAAAPLHPVPAQDEPESAERGVLPVELDDGWAVSGFEEEGLDPEPVLRLLREIEGGTFAHIHSVLIARHGALVAEAYFPGHAFDFTGELFRGPWTEFGPRTAHNLASVTKSVVGILVGIALDRDDLETVDASVFSFFPEYVHLADDANRKITLGHLLTMTSGLEWNEQDVPYDQEENDIIQLFLVPDPIEHVLSKDPASRPATRWRYNGGGTILLGEIIRRASGRRLDAYAQTFLFDPLSIDPPAWVMIDDVVYASGDLKLRPRDMAKLGQLVLEGGTWNGHRIVSEAWVDAMTRPHVPFQPSGGYGLHWWNRVYSNGSNKAPAFLADGWGGQRVMVFPTLDLVVVFTGGAYTEEPRLDEVVAHYVLPAVEGSGWQ